MELLDTGTGAIQFGVEPGRKSTGFTGERAEEKGKMSNGRRELWTPPPASRNRFTYGMIGTRKNEGGEGNVHS